MLTQKFAVKLLPLMKMSFRSSGANVIRLFTAVSYDFSWLARVFVPGKPFQPSLKQTLD